MTHSALWVGYPKAGHYAPGRNRAIQFVTLHYTAGSEGPSSAEAGADYDKRRPDSVSTHYFTDSEGPALQEVPDGDRAYTARQHGNEIGVHIEICGTRQTREQWLDGTSKATLDTTAWLVATLLKRHNLAFKRLSVEETRAAYYSPAGQRPTGINDHSACTHAFPEDGGDHEDVGSEFPWDVFMPQVKLYLSGADDMFMAQISGNQSVWISDGQTYRSIINFPIVQKLQGIGVQTIVVGSQAELEDLCGALWMPPTGNHETSLTIDDVNAQIAASTIHPPVASL